jgi:serine protease Do
VRNREAVNRDRTSRRVETSGPRSLLAATLLIATAACGPRAPETGSQPPASAAFRAAVREALPALVSVQVEATPTDALAGGALIGSGSGVVLSTDGLILTNNHVVADAPVVTVVFSDGRRLIAAVRGRDPDTDIAVLEVDADGLAAARLGDSDSVTVGDWVLALGYPLGLSATVTAGVVSGMGRSLGLLEGTPGTTAPLEHYIQTDAAINPGNSGGPMVDLAGRVVGINSAIASPTGYYAGYGFAVPINIARRVADDLIRFGQVTRPALGVRTADVEPADARVYGLAGIAGAEVVGVDPAGPAAAAGIELGDVIVGADSQPIPMTGHLREIVARHRPGETLRLQAVRYGRTMDFVVTLGRLPAPPHLGSSPPQHLGPARVGFTVVEDRGLVVSAVARYSPAARAGIRPGQRILELNRRAVGSVRAFEASLRALPAPFVLSLRVRDPALGETIVNYEPEPLHASRSP